jgi:hypothetical protein
MLKGVFAATAFPTEAQCGGEDGTAALPRLDGSGYEASPIPNAFDVVEYRDFRITRQEEVAVHTVNEEIGRDGALGSRQRLGDCCTAVDPTRPGRNPERASVCEDILERSVCIICII